MKACESLKKQEKILFAELNPDRHIQLIKEFVFSHVSKLISNKLNNPQMNHH